MSQPENNDLVIYSPEEMKKLPEEIPDFSILQSPLVMGHISNLAKTFARSQLIPIHYRGKGSDCFIALESARNLGINPFTYMQETTVINGKVGMSASLMSSILASKKVLRGILKFEFEERPFSKLNEAASKKFGGKNIRCRAYGTEASTGERLEGPWVDLEMAESEGWTRNKKYFSMPEIILEKRATTFFTRRFFPALLNGLMSEDEVLELQEAPKTQEVPSAELNFDPPPKSQAPKLEEPEEVNPDPVEETPPKEESQDLKEGSLPWLKSELEKLGVNYPSSARKPDLKALLNKTLQDLEEAAKEKEAAKEEPKEEIPEANLEVEPPQEESSVDFKMEENGDEMPMFPVD